MYDKQYYQQHKEQISNRLRKNYQSNKEKKKEYQKRWRKKHPKYNIEWAKKHPEQKRLANKRMLKKYLAMMHELKINGCAICGYDKCDRALDFHHVNPEDKKFQIRVTHMSNKNLIAEITKCILLCANCHMEIEDKEVKNA